MPNEKEQFRATLKYGYCQGSEGSGYCCPENNAGNEYNICPVDMARSIKGTDECNCCHICKDACRQKAWVIEYNRKEGERTQNELIRKMKEYRNLSNKE